MIKNEWLDDAASEELMDDAMVVYRLVRSSENTDKFIGKFQEVDPVNRETRCYPLDESN